MSIKSAFWLKNLSKEIEMTETSIVDFMKKIIEIFNQYAGEDKKLDKEELKQLLIQGRYCFISFLTD